MAFIKTDINANKAKDIFLKLKEKYPIESVLTEAEANEKYNLAGDFSLALTSSDNYTFTHGDILYKEAIDNHSSHGFLPEKAPFSPLIISNYETELKECNSVDIAPTILSLFNIFPTNMDGSVLSITPSHIR